MEGKKNINLQTKQEQSSEWQVKAGPLPLGVGRGDICGGGEGCSRDQTDPSTIDILHGTLPMFYVSPDIGQLTTRQFVKCRNWWFAYNIIHLSTELELEVSTQ